MPIDVDSRDPLTGAYSRAALPLLLREKIHDAQFRGQSVALLIVDLDYLKSINDAFGHRRGDQVLVEFVQRVRSLGETSDLLFRYGGDEFVVVLPYTDHLQARAWAERLLTVTRSEPFGDDPPLTITATIGSAAAPFHASTPEALFECADRRLLAAKRSGRDRIGGDETGEPRLPSLAAPARLIEREAGLSTVQEFLDELPNKLRGQLTITGPAGVGRSAMLAEVAHRARVQGYLVLELRASPGLRMRLYGALLDSQSTWPELPSPLAGTETWLRTVQEVLRAQDRRGLVITIDDFLELDHATLDLLRELLRTSERLVVGLATTIPESARYRPTPVNTRFALEMALAPLSLQGVGIWIRSVLQWEAPAAFRTWLHDQTMGLPGLLRSSLPKLDAQGILSATTAGWSLRPDYAATTLVSSSALLDGPRAYNLPASLNHFVGRERDIQYLKQQIGAGPLVTIVGAGGIGKTRLALQVAMEMLEQFRHGVWFVPLADVGSVEQMVFTIAIVLDLPLVAQRSAKDQLIAGLHNRDLLLVVDNMEHLLDGGGLLTEIIAQAPNVKLLVTSRERLGLPHETSIELKGLPFPAAGTEASLEHASAMRLFVHSARQRGQNFTVSDDDLPSIWQICRLVEGMPLGIELAAAWTALFTCREIADQLAHDYDFLAAAPGTAYPQNSLRTVFDYFWRQLSEDEQRVVRRLGVFRGGFDREAAHVIAGASPFLLAALVDKAFLTRTSTGRYSLHKLLQQYAETHLAAVPGDHAAVRQGHAAYYLMLAERAEHELLGDAQTTWLDRLEAEHENLRTVLAWSRDPATNELGLRLAGLLGQFWRVRGHCSEGRTWLREVLREEQTQSQYYWKALRWSGVLAQEQGDYSVAWEILEQCLASARRRDDRHGIADSQGYLGWIASVQGRYDQAHTLLTEGLAVARKLDDTVTILHILNNLGEVTYRQGRFADSRACYAESLILAQTLGDRREIGESLLGLGNAAMSQDRYAEAEATYNECLMHARTIDDRRRIGESLGNLGIVAQKRGAYAQAQQYFRDCLAVFEAIGNQLDIAMALVVLGTVALDLEDEQSARHYLRASLARAMAIGALPVALEALAGIAELHIRAGMPEQAAAWLGLIQAHPSISTEVRNNVTARLDALRAQLQEESYSLLRAQAQEHTLETVVAEVLGSMGMLSI